MTVTKQKEGSTLTVGVEGRLDTLTAPELEAEIKTDIDDVTDIIFDFGKLEYISSAGLRVLMFAMKTTKAKNGSMVVRNVSDYIKGIFKVSGIGDILKIE